ncbi:hypothetical protein [Mycoplasma todarodis]|uniref:Lipoprotein n=1 Tax=Mycoplasma todarodis TaxID=1937191 RepID=A0A4R0XM81_9MOLU|nr:hypothetical protein [Mycoplasma todarodis]TCG11807.1 hypothetical protein C4B25_00600 [Mycoplasma todarodis]
MKKKKIALTLGSVVLTTAVALPIVACSKDSKEKEINPNVRHQINVKADYTFKLDIQKAIDTAKEAKDNNKLKVKKYSEFKEKVRKQINEKEVKIFDTSDSSYKDPLSVLIANLINQIIDELNSQDVLLDKLGKMSEKDVEFIKNFFVNDFKTSKGKSLKDIFHIGARNQNNLMNQLKDYFETNFVPFDEGKLGPVLGHLGPLLTIAAPFMLKMEDSPLLSKNLELKVVMGNVVMADIFVEKGKLNKDSLDNLFHLKKGEDLYETFEKDMQDIQPVVDDALYLADAILSGEGGLKPNANAFPLTNRLKKHMEEVTGISGVVIDKLQSILKQLRDLYVTNK